jgi:hypothetical protein
MENPIIPTKDKEAISRLLNKPWNLYIFRHSALTQKSQILKEATLRDHAGWSINSKMPSVYLHYFGTESCNSLLETFGLVRKQNGQESLQTSKLCPSCKELNKQDSRFCVSCKMVLTYDAYNETLEKEQKRESEIQNLKDRYDQDIKAVREQMNQIMMMVQRNPRLVNIKPEVLVGKSQ